MLTNRRKGFMVMLNALEHDTLEELAQEQGCSMAVYLRMLLTQKMRERRASPQPAQAAQTSMVPRLAPSIGDKP